jgi:hypothetical protein
MNPSNPLQIEEPVIWNDSYYAASRVSPNAHHQDKKSSLFTIDRIAKPLPSAAQTLKDPHFEEPESQHPFFLLYYTGTNIYVFLLGNLKSIAMKLIYPLLWQQFNILRLFFRTKMKSLTKNPQMMMMSIHAFRTLQKTP